MVFMFPHKKCQKPPSEAIASGEFEDSCQKDLLWSCASKHFKCQHRQLHSNSLWQRFLNSPEQRLKEGVFGSFFVIRIPLWSASAADPYNIKISKSILRQVTVFINLTLGNFEHHFYIDHILFFFWVFATRAVSILQLHLEAKNSISQSRKCKVENARCTLTLPSACRSSKNQEVGACTTEFIRFQKKRRNSAHSWWQVTRALPGISTAFVSFFIPLFNNFTLRSFHFRWFCPLLHYWAFS